MEEGTLALATSGKYRPVGHAPNEHSVPEGGAGSLTGCWAAVPLQQHRRAHTSTKGMTGLMDRPPLDKQTRPSRRVQLTN